MMGQYDICVFLEQNKGEKFTAREMLDRGITPHPALRRLKKFNMINFEFDNNLKSWKYWSK